MFLREYFSNGNLLQITTIDAKNYSNKARFINHSCEPNLFVVPVRIDHMIPHAALFALRDIQIGEELSYDYGGGDCVQVEESKDQVLVRTVCNCGTKSCKGFLPDLKIF